MISQLWYDIIGQWSGGTLDVAGIGLENASTPLVWLGLLAYSLQLYFDFSGYSLMGIGMGKMLGFDFPMNFNLPYIASSITDFWRRWHITLSSWFKEYVYIPLGGNRRGIKRQIFNMFVVWALTGIWHGADWNFVLWGIYYFVLLTIEKVFLLDKLKRARSGPTFTPCSWWPWAGRCSWAMKAAWAFLCCSRSCSSPAAAWAACISCAITVCCWRCASPAALPCR